MKKIGLVLSGGMAKGAYQVGALKALARYCRPEQITAISAASVGALNGYAFLSGQLEKAEQMWRELAGQKKAFIGRLMKEGCLDKITRALTRPATPLPCPFYVALMNATELGLAYADLSKVPCTQHREFLKAGVSLPGFSPSVRLNGQNFFDGAVIDNIPVHPLAGIGLDYLICIYFDGRDYIFENSQVDETIVKITFAAQQRITPSLWIERETAQQMMEEGYCYANSVFSALFCCDRASFPAFQKRMDACRANKKKELRITGDLVVDNLNRVAQKFAKRSNLFD